MQHECRGGPTFLLHPSYEITRTTGGGANAHYHWTPPATQTEAAFPVGFERTDKIDTADPHQAILARDRVWYWNPNNPGGQGAHSLGGSSAGWTYVHAYGRVGRRIEVALLMGGLGSSGTWQQDKRLKPSTKCLNSNMREVECYLNRKF